MRFRGGDIARASGSRGLNINSNLELAPIEIQQLPEAAVYAEKSGNTAEVQFAKQLKQLSTNNFKYNTIRPTSSLTNNARRFAHSQKINRLSSMNNKKSSSLMNKIKSTLRISGGKKRSKKTLRRQA
jgi:hypothetical protein